MMQGTGKAPPSLRRTLLIWLLAPLVGLVPLTAALIYLLARSPALDALDRALTGTAVALAEIVESRDGQVSLPLSPQTARALSADLVDETVFAVKAPDGRLLGGSVDLMALAPPMQAGAWHFQQALLAGKPVRLAVHGAACGAKLEEVCVIVVAETLGKRNAAQRAALLAAGVGAAVLALPLVLFSMLAIRRTLRPLSRAVADVESLMPHRLAPIDAQGMPREVLGFVHALNRLLARLHEAAAAQRAFVADAAHQLRTPLSVMRVETAQALATPHSPDLHPVLERLHAGAERGSRLAQQLLALARAEGAALDPGLKAQRLDLSVLVAGMAERWLRPALEAGQDLGFALQPARVEGHAMLLEEAIGNLIDNAISHAGTGTSITVRTETREGRSWLSVEDDGRGVPQDNLDTLWQRFRRGRDASSPGSGLGLAIVADIARLHGAEARIEPAAGGRGGLRALLIFPLATGTGP